MSSSPCVLTEFLDRAPADAVAIVLPEQNITSPTATCASR